MPDQMWFGTEGRMRWITVPSPGFDSSPVDRSASGVLLNGGGYSIGSYGSHKQYQFAWSNASSRTDAQIMKSYADGTFGRGLIWFHDPLAYTTNILPAHWADPSLAIADEAPPLLRTWDVPMTDAATASFTTNDLPDRTVTYNLATAVVGYPGALDSLFIPVPPGYTLRIGAFFSRTGTGGIFWAPVNAVGAVGTATLLTANANTATNITPDTLTPGTLGVRIWLGKSASGAGTVSIAAMIARLSGPTTGPWVGGQGHSGCAFVGKPTYIEYSGTNGGQVGYAATLKEVGAWTY